MIVFGLLVLLFVYPFFLLNSEVSVADQWSVYVAPLNQIPLFIGGLFVGHLILNQKINPRVLNWLVGVGGFVFLAISYLYSTSYCISGFLRVILIIVCLVWCLFFGLLRTVEGRLGRFLDWIGMLSYSSYLLHPIAYKGVDILLAKMLPIFFEGSFKAELQVFLTFSGGLVVTMVMSHFSYLYLEKPMMRIGRRFATR